MEIPLSITKANVMLQFSLCISVPAVDVNGGLYGWPAIEPHPFLLYKETGPFENEFIVKGLLQIK